MLSLALALDFLSPPWTLAGEGERPFFASQLARRVRPIGAIGAIGAATKSQLASWVQWRQKGNQERIRSDLESGGLNVSKTGRK